MVVDTLEAILKFERFLNTDLNAPRYDRMSYEELLESRTRNNSEVIHARRAGNVKIPEKRNYDFGE